MKIGLSYNHHKSRGGMNFKTYHQLLARYILRVGGSFVLATEIDLVDISAVDREQHLLYTYLNHLMGLRSPRL